MDRRNFLALAGAFVAGCGGGNAVEYQIQPSPGRRLGGINVPVSRYQEGFWTPVFTFQTAGDLSVVVSEADGQYTLNGDIVVCFFALRVTPTFTTSTGEVRITGVPFHSRFLSALGGSGFEASGGIARWNSEFVIPRMGAGGSVPYFEFQRASAGNVGASDLTSGALATFLGHIIYKVDFTE